MATEVSVVSRATGQQTFFSDYDSARTAASEGDLIQIWSDLTDQQILLKDKVDIWIAPGRLIETSDSMSIIVDNDGSYTDPVTVNITGYGIFKNTNDKYGCVKISNSGSKVSIQCISMENMASDADSDERATINIVNAAKFHLICNKVTNLWNRAINFENAVDDINIRVGVIQSGTYGEEYAGEAAVTILGSGFLEANEIISNCNGSCLVLKKGNLTANILKITTNEAATVSANSTILLANGTGTQNLTLYFDEIQNLSAGGDCIKANEGILNLIGRRIYSSNGLSMDLSANADCLIVEIISATKGIYIHNSSSQKVIIDANYIEGSDGNNGVIYCNETVNVVLRNAKIKNTTTSTPSIGIYIAAGSQANQKIEIENLIVVTGTATNDRSIFREGTTEIHIKNLGLFVNRIVSTLVILDIGDDENFKYIVSTDIS